MPAENQGVAMRVEVIYALPDRAWSARIELPEGSTAAEALSRSGLPGQVPGMEPATLGYAVFGRPIGPQTILRDGDRLELLRPLNADPKQARRRRALGKS